MTSAAYNTIGQTGESIFRDRGSRFLGRAEFVRSEAEVKAIIDSLRKLHPQAVHVCSAFRLGADKKLYRSSDDGEPANSAGPPILGQIQSADLTNVLVTVVRYYGGVNLGVGGLINAYRTAAKEAIMNAEIIQDEDRFHFELQFDYPIMPEVMTVLKSGSAVIREQDFQLTCSMRIELKASDLSFLDRLNKIHGLTILSHDKN